MAKIKFCGLTINAGKVTTYGGGHIFPGARDIGRHARVSAATARKITASIGVKPPRPGYEMLICGGRGTNDAQYLVNHGGKYEVVRRASGEFAGARRRKRR